MAKCKRLHDKQMLIAFSSKAFNKTFTALRTENGQVNEKPH